MAPQLKIERKQYCDPFDGLLPLQHEEPPFVFFFSLLRHEISMIYECFQER